MIAPQIAGITEVSKSRRPVADIPFMRTSSTHRTISSDPAFIQTRGTDSHWPVSIQTNPASGDSQLSGKRCASDVISDVSFVKMDSGRPIASANHSSGRNWLGRFCLIALTSVFLLLSGIQSSASATCGGVKHSSMALATGQSSTNPRRELVLPMSFQYIAGQFVATHQEPRTPCAAGGCKSKQGMHSDSLPPRSFRNIRVTIASYSPELSASDIGVPEFNRVSVVGAARDGHMFSIEHPPKSI